MGQIVRAECLGGCGWTVTHDRMNGEIDLAVAKMSLIECPECGGGLNYATAPADDPKRVKGQRDRAWEAVSFMCGSDDFSPGGKARRGFLKVVEPVLREMEPPNQPPEPTDL